MDMYSFVILLLIIWGVCHYYKNRTIPVKAKATMSDQDVSAKLLLAMQKIGRPVSVWVILEELQARGVGLNEGTAAVNHLINSGKATVDTRFMLSVE
jgi:hypothetical protein